MEKNIDKISDLVAFNSYGGFNKSGDEYHILNTKTPLPWCNVLANEKFGTIISSYGTVYTYFKNSREYKLTSWCNDWTKVTPGEKFTGIFENNNYNLVYGFGYVKVTEEEKYIEKNMDIFIPVEDNVKIQKIKIKNKKKSKSNFEITYKLDPVLGVSSEVDATNIISKINNETIVLKNPYSKEFSNCYSYVKGISYNTDKIDFKYNLEEYLLTCSIELDALEELDFAILLGSFEERNFEDFNVKLESIINKYSDIKNVEQEYENVIKYWRDKVKTDIKTEDEYVNIMASGWLLYQTIACRLFAKSAFYQSGGAIGYRDQLQDTMSLLSSWPEKTKSQIILHSSKQFEKGDVLHWWHEHTGAGIRTYFSDDYLWLAYVLCEYVIKTNDYSILQEETPYLEDKDMGDHRELYEVFKPIDKFDSVYNHAKKTITYSLSRINKENGLLDIGDGDWNDGFSNIRGQSVWLTLFVIDILKKFAPIANYMKDEEMIAICNVNRKKLKDSVVANAYEEEHFVRAYFENGEVLGSFTNEECKVDLISQVWAAISLKDFPTLKDKINSSLETAEKYLVDDKSMIIKLLYPPFDKPKNNPGYIKSYVPGIRENGGQYTHAATWLPKAYFELKEHDKGLKMLKYLCPIYHSDTKKKADTYMVEPYVLAADIYSNPEHLGRGGWTWYTGSSSWYFKVIEDEYKK